MDTSKKLKIFLAYMAMIIAAFALLYFLDHVILKLPARLSLFWGGLTTIAITIGAFIALTKNKGK